MSEIDPDVRCRNCGRCIYLEAAWMDQEDGWHDGGWLHVANASTTCPAPVEGKENE